VIVVGKLTDWMPLIESGSGKVLAKPLEATTTLEDDKMGRDRVMHEIVLHVMSAGGFAVVGIALALIYWGALR
jgi:hypothetical protein